MQAATNVERDCARTIGLAIRAMPLLSFSFLLNALRSSTPPPIMAIYLADGNVSVITVHGMWLLSVFSLQFTTITASIRREAISEVEFICSHHPSLQHAIPQTAKDMYLICSMVWP